MDNGGMTHEEAINYMNSQKQDDISYYRRLSIDRREENEKIMSKLNELIDENLDIKHENMKLKDKLKLERTGKFNSIWDALKWCSKNTEIWIEPYLGTKGSVYIKINKNGLLVTNYEGTEKEKNSIITEIINAYSNISWQIVDYKI